VLICALYLKCLRLVGRRLKSLLERRSLSKPLQPLIKKKEEERINESDHHN
jgi:hypothetical protein